MAKFRAGQREIARARAMQSDNTDDVMLGILKCEETAPKMYFSPPHLKTSLQAKVGFNWVVKLYTTW